MWQTESYSTPTPTRPHLIPEPVNMLGHMANKIKVVDGHKVADQLSLKTGRLSWILQVDPR